MTKPSKAYLAKQKKIDNYLEKCLKDFVKNCEKTTDEFYQAIKNHPIVKSAKIMTIEEICAKLETVDFETVDDENLLQNKYGKTKFCVWVELNRVEWSAGSYKGVSDNTFLCFIPGLIQHVYNICRSINNEAYKTQKIDVVLQYIKDSFYEDYSFTIGIAGGNPFLDFLYKKEYYTNIFGGTNICYGDLVVNLLRQYSANKQYEETFNLICTVSNNFNQVYVEETIDVDLGSRYNYHENHLEIKI